MLQTFKLTGPDEGKTKIILDKYCFVDGVMTTDDDFCGQQYEKILCVYYGCTHEVTNKPEEKLESGTGLGKAATKSVKQKD